MPKEVGRKAGRVSRARSLKAWVLGFGGLWRPLEGVGKGRVTQTRPLSESNPTS